MASSSFRWIYNVFRWIYNVFASFTGEIFGKLFRSHLVKELDRKMMDTSKDDEMEIASSSSGSRRYDVFPSFRGEDVRGSFLSHLLKELRRKSITFIDDEIERSRLIAPELLSAIRGSRIAIVVFSKNYASSTWCLNELVEIHKCFTNLNQMVIPIFFHVDPSEVKKQTGDFGKVFENTCKGKSEDEKQSWKQALADVATMAGEDLRNWPNEASMIEKVAQDVLKKTMTSSDEFGDFVGIEDHLEALNSMLCWESEDAIMVGISGTSGIGKTTIARALYSQLSSQFHLRAFETCRRTIGDDYCQKLLWEEQLLSKMLDEKNLKIEIVGAVKERLKEKKVLIVLDDVDDLELLNTLVGQAGWFGSGSRIIVITQDRRLLEAHEIELIHEVEFPSELLALKIFCRSAFAQDSPPDGFVELAVEVAKLAGNLPLGLSVLGSSLRRRGKAEWRKMLPMLRNGLDGKIEKTLRVSYDRLDRKERDLFLYIACLFNGDQVRHIIDLFRDSVDIRLTMLAEKSLIRITTQPETVVMHNLLQKLGREIVRAESIDNPGRRRFLVDIQDIRDVLIDNDNTGMQTVLGIYLDASYTPESFSINDQSFESVRSLQFLIVSDYRLWLKYRRGKLLIPMHMDSDGLFSFPVDPKWLQLGTGGRLDLPKRLVYLPPKLKLLRWSNCPFNYLPYSFKGAYLVELTMENSNLKKLWKGTPQLGMLKRMDMRGSRHLKEIPDLSTAINLEDLILIDCSSLVTLPSSIGNVTRLKHLYMMGCTKLEKLWDGVQSLASLERVDMSGCKNLTEIPDLSKATNLESLRFNNCKSLVTVPSTIGNLQNLLELQMKGCTGLEVLPTYVNLSSLQILDLSGCSSLRTFPLISTSIVFLYLEDTAIEEVPSCIESFSSLVVLMMYRCKRLKDISLKIFGMTRLTFVDFADCRGATLAFRRHHKIDHSDIPLYKNIEYTPRRKLFRHFVGPDFHGTPVNGEYFSFQNCFKLDRYVREGILRSCSRPMALPGGEVPMSFQHRAHGDSLTVTLPQSSLAREFLEVKACVVIDFPPTEGKDSCSCLEVKIGRTYRKSFFENSADLQLCKMDHLFSCSFKLETKNLPSESAVNNVEFKFSCFNRIKECGVMIDSDGSSEKESPDDSDGSSAKESPDDSDGMIRLYNASLEKIDLSGGKNLREIPDLSKATNLVKLTLNNCTSLVTVPSTIGKLQKLIELHMKGCTGLEVLPTDVNLSSLEVLDLSGCSSLRTFPRISRSIKLLYLENTAIEEVPCCIENFGGLTVLMMCCCKRLKIISPNIFRMKSLKFVDFTDCRDATLAFSDATMEDHSDIPLYENIEYTPRRKLFRHNGDHPNHYSLPNEPYFSFQNCFKLGRDVREGILRSCSEPVALPGGEVPTYFQHRAYGDSLTVTLPQGSLSQESLDFKTCVLVDFPPTEGKDSCSYLEVELDFDGVKFRESFFEDAAELQLCKTNHLFSCSFSLVTKNIPSELAFKYLELKFSCFNTIKECGVMIHSDGSSEKESPDGSDGSSEKKSPDDRDGSSEKESPDDSDGSSEKESPDDSDGMILLYDAESGGVEFVADEVDRINEKVLDWDETEALRKGLETIRGLCN